MAAAALWLGSVIRMRRTGLRLDQARRWRSPGTGRR
jgi:hypothetical protein